MPQIVGTVLIIVLIIFLLLTLVSMSACNFNSQPEQIFVNNDSIIIFRTNSQVPLMHYSPLPDGGSKVRVDSLFENGSYTSKEFIFNGLYSQIDSVIKILGPTNAYRNAYYQINRNASKTEPLIYALQLKLPRQQKSFCIIQWCKPLQGEYTLHLKNSYAANETSQIIFIEVEFANGYKKEYRYQLLGFYPDSENPYL